MENPFESKIPKPTPEDIDSIIRHVNDKELEIESNDNEELDNQKLDKAIVNDSQISINKARIIDKEVLNRINELRDKSFSDVSNWAELTAMIISKGDIIMAGKKYSALEVVDLINKVKNGEVKADVITRTDKFRAKVIELMKSEE